MHILKTYPLFYSLMFSISLEVFVEFILLLRQRENHNSMSS